MTDSPAQLFDSRSAIAAFTDFGYSPRKTRPPLPSPQELKAQREDAIVSGCVYRRGPNGTTVFNFGFAGEPFKRWDGYRGQ